MHLENDKKTTQASWDKKNKSIFATIALMIKSSKQEYIHEYKIAKKIWEYLKEVYQKKGIHR